MIQILKDKSFIAQREDLKEVTGQIPDDLFLSLKDLVEGTKTQEELEEEVKEKEKEKLIDIINGKTTDDEKLQLIDIYDEWILGKAYVTDDYVQYQDKLYKCLQAHTSQGDWTPDKAVSLWAQIGTTNPDTGLEELYPSSTNLYSKDKIGTYEGHVYKSNYDNNGNTPYIGSVLPDWWTDLGTINEYLGG